LSNTTFTFYTVGAFQPKLNAFYYQLYTFMGFKLPKLSYFFFSEEILVRECRNTSSTSTPVEEMVEVCQDPDQEANITDADDGACTLR
jgi:hypothetical protein